jgi:hypothetical protein
VGVLLGTLFVFSVYGFAGDRPRSAITGLAFFYAGWMGVAGGIASFAGLSPPGLEMLWGFVTNVQLLAFYAAPLSTLAAVLKARDASSIAANWPMTAVSTVNASLWAAYGIAIARPFVWAPNVVGLVLGAVQLGLCVCLPAGGRGRKKGAAGARVEDEDFGKAPLVTVALQITPAGRAAGGGAKAAAAASSRRLHAAGSLSASLGRALSFGQWSASGEAAGAAQAASGGWLARTGRHLSSSLRSAPSGGSSRGLGGSSGRGLLGGSSRGGERRAWTSAGGEAAPAVGGGAAARAATAGDEEAGRAAAAVPAPAALPASARPAVTRTATFGQEFR